MPVPEGGGGGGGGGSIPHLVVSPGSPYNLGSQVVGVNLTGNLSVRSTFGTIGWNVVSNSNPIFTIGPPTSGVASTSGTLIPILINQGVAGSYTTTVVIVDDNGALHTVVINATFVVAGSTLVANPTSVTFPTGVLNATPATQVVALSNNTGGLIAVTSIVVAGKTFSCLTPTPFNIPNGGSVNITLQTDYSLVGVFMGTATVNSALGPLVIPLNVTIFFLNSVDVLQNTSRAIMLGFTNLIKKFDVSFDSELDQVLVFNDTLWDSPGNEKTLRRIEVLYENVGVCTGLKLDLKSWRQTLTPPAYDTETVTISIGDVSADLSERSAFFDVEMAGELIVVTLTRIHSTGPVSILGFIPHFEDKGEKVENV